MENAFELPLADVGQRLQEVVDDAVRRIGGADRVDALDVFSQQRNPGRTPETTALLESAHAMLEKCTDRSSRLRREAAVMNSAPPADAEDSPNDLEDAANDALSFLAERHRIVFVVLSSAHSPGARELRLAHRLFDDAQNAWALRVCTTNCLDRTCTSVRSRGPETGNSPVSGPELLTEMKILGRSAAIPAAGA